MAKKKTVEKDQPSPADLNPGKEATADAGHDDAAQDKALIRKMLFDVFGQDASENEEAHSMAHEMYQRAKKAGDNHDEAMACAKYGMKAAKHQHEADESKKESEKKEADEGKKEAEESKKEGEEKKESSEKKEDEKKEAADESKEASKKEDEKKESADEKKEAEGEEKKEAAKKDDDKDDKKEADESDEKKESNALRAKLAAVVAENTKLKEAVETTSIAAHIEKLCKDSGLKVKVTKEFRSLVEGVKSVQEIDRVWGIFSKACKESSSDFSEGFTFATEKTLFNADSSEQGAIGFGDCVNND